VTVGNLLVTSRGIAWIMLSGAIFFQFLELGPKITAVKLFSLKWDRHSLVCSSMFWGVLYDIFEPRIFSGRKSQPAKVSKACACISIIGSFLEFMTNVMEN